MTILFAMLKNPWVLLAFALLVCSFAVHGWINEKAAFDSFKGATAALGKEAEDRTAAQIKFDKLNKEKADADHDAKVASLAATIGELRKSHPAGSFVPAAPVPAVLNSSASIGPSISERMENSLQKRADSLTKAQRVP